MRIMQDLRSSLLHSEIKKIIPSHLRLSVSAYILAALLLPFLLPAASTALAGSATWNLNPGKGDWNTATNWMPATVPNGPTDTATFGVSNLTGVSISGPTSTEVDGIVFNAGASAFTITVSPLISLYFEGVGITNNSGITQNFVTAVNGAGNFGHIAFLNSATAGNGTFFTNNGGTVSNNIGGLIEFFDTSTAGNGTFINNGSAVGGARGGATVFFSNAGNGTLINNGGTFSGAGGGETSFEIGSTAGNATLIANGGLGGGGGGTIRFTSTRGGTARVEVFGNGNLDTSSHVLAGSVMIGSIEGDGLVFLGSNNVSVGSNNASTNFSGVIQDGGGNGGTGASLIKVGTGTLVLTNANTYTGGTTIKHGTLMVNNRQGSGTGSGPVQINGRRLVGKGTIAGAVTVGTGIGSGAVLSPGYLHGANKLGALTIQSTLTFNSDATYEAELNSSSTTADEVIANGATINSGAQFSFADLGTGTLPPGTVFTVIDNTAATPIAGTFSNLPDGSMFTINGNTYQVNYEGGDGNDLTLTVVP
jgi:autotransporter-associated beta strand protein